MQDYENFAESATLCSSVIAKLCYKIKDPRKSGNVARFV
ncbi:protein of unknown function [Clostridium beijerinckii]|nr:protein of unknown function [Clostridium beijerinckii]